MITYKITWNDGEVSTESFNSVEELYEYFSVMEEENGVTAITYEEI